ncbi:methyltransferase domain-containing protein [Actomonas aquatica]|uniref:Class I SAM-dependent methyltransferase n=1 Tax=Actomonas aquatica TaxID=2866162 RepID=A0ABZ1C6W1_9BACT|nr:class I SAM-dependent methyltransferase [Opitutus sp. WL0086]WRQ87138.1 class I SAM-dependent methyltransferase [Opitutus sp. WL0086]
MSFLTAPYRRSAYAMLSGRGLEIGALNKPSPVPPAAQVEYFDAMTAEDARQLFPEIGDDAFVSVDHLGELDHDGLAQFEDQTFEFVILSHVIEHVANPIRVLAECFRILRPNGLLLIAVPDKRYTYDRDRALTTFDHLWADYENGVTENDDEHYLDFLRHVGPHVFDEPAEYLPGHIVTVRRRREHAHVWDSGSWRAMFDQATARLGITASCEVESPGSENHFEYFGAWRKR